MSLPRPGQLVDFCQKIGATETWVPFVVTHVHPKEKTISGVALSGLPGRVSWGRAAQNFSHVKRGDDHRHWRPIAKAAGPNMMKRVQDEVARAIEANLGAVIDKAVAAALAKVPPPEGGTAPAQAQVQEALAAQAPPAEPPPSDATAPPAPPAEKAKAAPRKRAPRKRTPPKK